MIRRSFHPLLEKAGLPKIRFHDLRHTAATLLLAAGENPKIVAEMLGHSTVNMTLNVYSHVTPSMQKQAAAKMDAILTAAPDNYLFSCHFPVKPGFPVAFLQVCVPGNPCGA